MHELSNIFQSADWKKEKHVPVIDAPEKAKKGEKLAISVTVGKEIAHPNTTEHHIAWIDVYFHPEDAKFPCNLGRFEFWAHGASTDGPNTSSVYTHPSITLTFKTEKPGTIFAFSHCNVHGFWMNSHELKVD
jgi:superoxide reductase